MSISYKLSSMLLWEKATLSRIQLWDAFSCDKIRVKLWAKASIREQDIHMLKVR